MKPTALEKFLQNHKNTCKVHVYSGKRNCTCERDAAAAELAQLRARLAAADKLADAVEDIQTPPTGRRKVNVFEAVAEYRKVTK